MISFSQILLERELLCQSIWDKPVRLEFIRELGNLFLKYERRFDESQLELDLDYTQRRVRTETSKTVQLDLTLEDLDL